MGQIYETKVGNLACYVGLTVVQVGCVLGILYGLDSSKEVSNFYDPTSYKFLLEMGLIFGGIGVGATASMFKKDLRRIKKETIDKKVLE
ncbi:MAG: hypothetical protein ABIF40_00515 [archaeon]